MTKSSQVIDYASFPNRLKQLVKSLTSLHLYSGL